MKSYDAAKYMS